MPLADEIRAQGPSNGLLGLAFHPKYAANGLFYVAYTDRGEVGGLRVDAHFAEETLDAFPRAARRDAHALVVITGAAA